MEKVYQKLSSISVQDKVEKKGRFELSILGVGMALPTK